MLDFLVLARLQNIAEATSNEGCRVDSGKDTLLNRSIASAEVAETVIGEVMMYVRLKVCRTTETGRRCVTSGRGEPLASEINVCNAVKQTKISVVDVTFANLGRVLARENCGCTDVTGGDRS